VTAGDASPCDERGAVAEIPLLELQHVTVVRGGRTVLDDFSLVVRHREHVAIVGPNGAGKSTLLKLLSRELYPVPSPATVCRILGKDRWNVFALRAGLGIVSNDIAAWLDGNATAGDVVLSGFFSSASLETHHTVTAAMRDGAANAMARLGIERLARRSIGSLSSGELRRTTIARALATSPRALVFDEPTTSLDIGARREVRDAMRDLARGGVSIVLVTHLLEEIVPEIERVVLLAGGRAIADGPKSDVLTAERLSALFGVPVDVDVRDGYYDVR